GPRQPRCLSIQMLKIPSLASSLKTGIHSADRFKSREAGTNFSAQRSLDCGNDIHRPAGMKRLKAKCEKGKGVTRVRTESGSDRIRKSRLSHSILATARASVTAPRGFYPPSFRPKVPEHVLPSAHCRAREKRR